ncbi:MAG: methionine gamma-lyase family protein [Eubacteriales bacterium]|nr:methionine gamma-lyase family protein [Eubacteriales bacterium]
MGNEKQKTGSENILTGDGFQVDPQVIQKVEEAEKKLSPRFQELDHIKTQNQYKVVKALRENRISDSHFAWNTGYGYDDAGRAALEKVYASIFHTEAALVRTQIVNGTHALAITLAGILRPGDEMIYCSGGPYDTLEEVIGIRGEGMGSLKEFGITYKQVELLPDGNIDLKGVKSAIGPKTKMCCVQRSTGYAWRKALSIDQIREWVLAVKSVNSDIVCMADNCYGEFTNLQEPTDAGVDVIAGSLIKNPGGGLALSGGYVAGKKDLVKKISYRLTCPGIGDECGLMFGQTRPMLQGMFLAPSVTNAALKGALLCGELYSDLGFETCPGPMDARNDIIQAVKLGTPERVVTFCQGVQEAAPVDSFVTPEPWDMPGYEDPVVMAAGAFVQGSSIELSADGPIRPPYIVYFQGGLTYEHSRLGVMMSLDRLLKKGLISIK